MEQCYLLWTYRLPGGTCAQWFSGVASAVAVAVALGAHFYAAWRQRRLEQRQDAAEVAGISMMLRGILKDSEANLNLFLQTWRTYSLWNDKYALTDNLGAVKALQFDFLDKNQADVLLRNSQHDVAERIYILIGRINFCNLGIEDYAKIRAEFSLSEEKYVGANLEDQVERESLEAKLYLKRLGGVSHAAEYFRESTMRLLREAVETTDAFNKFCRNSSRLSKYQIDTSRSAGLLKALGEDKREADSTQ